MKKPLLFLVFFFNMMPFVVNKRLTFFQVSGAKAQSQSILTQQLTNYLNSLDNGKTYWVVGTNNIAYSPGDCGPLPACTIPVSSLLNEPTIKSGFSVYLVEHNIELPPTSNEYDEFDEDGDDDVDWGEIDFYLDNARSEARLETFAAIEWWQTNGGQEPINEAPPCTEWTMFTIDFTYDFYEGNVQPPAPNSYDGTLGPSNLSCANKFLLGGNVVRFTSGQLSNIINYSFGDGRLCGVQFTNGDNYERAIKYDVIEQTMSYDSYNANCPDDFQAVKYNLINRRGSYQFVCFPNVYGLAGVETHTSSNSAIEFYKGVPDTTLAGYTFVIPNSNIMAANPGDSVLGMTSGSYSCMALDCAGVQNGTAYTDSCGRCVGGTTGRVDCKPCDSLYKTIGDSLYDYLNKPEFYDSLNKFKQNTVADTVEKAISLGVDSISNTFKATGIRIAQGSSFVSLIDLWPGIKVYKKLHFHPDSTLTCFSGGDFYSLMPFTDPRFKQITSQYVYGAHDSSFFAMAITDSALYSTFLQNNSMGITIDLGTGTFDTSTNIGQDYRRVFNYLTVTLSLSEDDALTQTIAYIMSKYNTGLALYRRKLGEAKFTKINTKVTTVSPGNETYAVNNCL